MLLIPQVRDRGQICLTCDRLAEKATGSLAWSWPAFQLSHTIAFFIPGSAVRTLYQQLWEAS